MFLVLRKDPHWPETLCSTDVCGGALTLLGKDGCQVQVPAALLVAVSPMVNSMMADLLPPAHSPQVISIPAVTGPVLLLVAQLLSEGAAVLHANNGEVQEVFKMMGIKAFFSYCVAADREVKNENSAEDCSQSENNLSDRNKSSSNDFLLPSKENKPEENKSRIECDENILKKYIRNHPVKKSFKCDQCAYGAESSVHLNRHMLIHGERSYSCDECDHRCISSKRLKQHMLVHSTEKPFACDKCAYRAVRKANLKTHMLIHSSEKPFACDQCSYQTAIKGNLKQHMEIHTEEKQIACGQCSYRCGSRKLLKEHMLVHSTEKLFACEECAYRAVRRKDLNKHMLIHSSEKPFACDKCAYKAVIRGNLKRHMLTHIGEKLFVCDQCDFKVTNLRSLKLHKAKTHDFIN